MTRANFWLGKVFTCTVCTKTRIKDGRKQTGKDIKLEFYELLSNRYHLITVPAGRGKPALRGQHLAQTKNFFIRRQVQKVQIKDIGLGAQLLH